MKNNNQGKLLTIALGVILAISAGVLAYLAVSTKPPKLSEEKMQKQQKPRKKKTSPRQKNPKMNMRNRNP